MITSLSEEVGRSHKRGQVKDFESAYRQLNDFVDKLNDKILNRLQLFQQVYLQDYKQQVALMNEQLKQLRANLDSENLYQKSNQKAYILEEERDFFRAQVLKLNGQVNVYVEQNKRLKRKVVDLQVEIANFKKISINYQKKVQKFQLQRTEMANFKRDSSVPVLPKPVILYQEKDVEHQSMQNVNEEKSEASISSRVNFFERKPNQTVRTRTYSKGESGTKASMRRYEIANEREQLIDDCIKEIKKQIFFRTGDQKGQAVASDEINKVSFDKFTRTDKKNLIHKILANDKMLDQFGEFLASKSVSFSASRMAKTKIGDEKFNEKFLIDLKRSFSKKIFDLKTNQQMAIRNTFQRKLI